MSEYKNLLKNTGLLFLGNFGSRILGILLVPIYTSALSTAEFGTYSIYTVTASLLMPVLTFNIVEAVFRFASEEYAKKKTVFSIGCKYSFAAILIFSILLMLNQFFGIIKVYTDYPGYLVAYFCVHLFFDMIFRFARGMNYVLQVSLGGLLNTVAALGLNIALLKYYHFGLPGFFVANIVSLLIAAVYLVISTQAWRYIGVQFRITAIEKEMLSYSTPLIFDATAWWVNNASDRFIVDWFCGTTVTGIYSIAYKIPTLLNAMSTIFNQAWIISSIREYKNGNQSFFIKTYKYINAMTVIFCSGILLANRVIATILFKKEFFEAWQFAPFLTISAMFTVFIGFMEGIYAAAKKTRILAATTVSASIINIVLNIILVKAIGAVGAAISTAICYFLIWFLRMRLCEKHLNINVSIGKDIIFYVALGFQAFAMYRFDAHRYLIQAVLFLVIVLGYWRDVLPVLKKLLKIR
jgi:O-antigen/teichoic acid export membrane protein